MNLGSCLFPRLLPDAEVLHVELDAEAGERLCSGKHQLWIYKATHAAVPGEKLTGLNKGVVQRTAAKSKLQQSGFCIKMQSTVGLYCCERQNGDECTTTV